MDVEAGRGNISVRRLADLAAALQTTAADLVTAHAERPAPRVIALLGLRGAGKTTVGRRLARRLRMRFVELDRQIETARRPGARARSSRSTARTTTAGSSATRSPTCSRAGSRWCSRSAAAWSPSPETYALLLRQATTVWLKARADDYWTRVIRQGDRRPIDQHPQAREALRELVARRDPLYARAGVTRRHVRA